MSQVQHKETLFGRCLKVIVNIYFSFCQNSSTSHFCSLLIILLICCIWTINMKPFCSVLCYRNDRVRKNRTAFNSFSISNGFSISKSYHLIPVLSQEPSRGFTVSCCCVTVACLFSVCKMRYYHGMMLWL